MQQIIEAYDGFVPAMAVLFVLAVMIAAISATLRRNLERARSTFSDPLLDGLLMYSTLFTAYLVLSPQPQIAERVRLQFGNDLWTALSAAPGDSLPWAQLAGNLFLLFPLGVLVPMRVGWFDKHGKIFLGGLVTAFSIEVIQFLAVSGRVASTDDVVLNTLGVVLGGFVVCRGRAALPAQVPESVRTAPEPSPLPTTSGTSPQHSLADPEGRAVWRIIAKIEEERRRRGDATSKRRQVREPARHP